MFFNRHIKQGRELGNAGRIMLMQSLESTQYRGRFTLHPPDDFFDNLYIRGFLDTWISFLISVAYGGANWSEKKKGRCSIEAMLTIDPSGKLKRHFVALIDPEVRDQIWSSEPYREGYNAAILVVGAAYNRLYPDDPDPILAEAKPLAIMIEKSSIQDLYPLQNKISSLAAAITILTINKYVTDKWSGDIS